VEYSLSELGDAMRPIISPMGAWGVQYKESLACSPGDGLA
jgi:DNA-binding HxlR family transcriptional regulator